MPVTTATLPFAAPPGPATVTRPLAFAAATRAETAPEVAVVLTGLSAPDEIAAAVRGYKTVLPGTAVWLFHDGRRADCAAAAERAGAQSRLAPGLTPNALLRRIFAEVEADVLVLADGPGCNPSLAPQMVAEVEARALDFINVVRLRTPGDPGPDFGERVLSWTADYLFGRGGIDMTSGYKACSRRFAQSYQAEPGDLDAALTLTLHAMRLRMPFGEIASVGRPPSPLAAAHDRKTAARFLGLSAWLLVNERPRRVFGMAGLALVGGGIASALPAVHIHDWHATLRFCPASALAVVLIALGAATGVAGTALDMLAKARQEVKRLGYLAIPRRAEPL